MEDKEYSVLQTVTFYIKGRHIHLTRPIIASILRVSDKGLDFIMVKDHVQFDPNCNYMMP